MRLPHRRWHRLIWVILPAIVVVLCIAALAIRPDPTHRAIPIGEASR
jgi:hypothetical protein